ncbi:thioesterase II family protein [Candidatus Protofrankia datiscae]|uniref:Thioesterase n=1 Tax=Candidatus Protofrankia datiscae TaxID=2716812 RepID=F8AWN1_9ACTN|nr:MULTISPECIES: alpha/beta fold hydrolase [Protofrankia]AEH09370.1 Thioesterase [Candidatus Protofrankia datiscae]
MAGNTTGNTERWLRQFHPGPPDGPLLVCFPHAGGAASFYLPMARALSATTRVRAVQYPGRQDRRSEPPLTTIAALADALAEVLDAFTGQQVAFFGHSMGAIVGFEVIRRLEAAGRPGPRVLFASGRRAPSVRRGDRVHLLDDAGFLREIRALGGTDPRVLDDPEMLALVLPPTRADYRAIETYVGPPDATVRTPVTVLVGDTDPHATAVDAERWREHTGGDFDVRVFPGGHFYLVDQQQAVTATIVAALRDGPAAGQRPAAVGQWRPDRHRPRP